MEVILSSQAGSSSNVPSWTVANLSMFEATIQETRNFHEGANHGEHHHYVQTFDIEGPNEFQQKGDR